MKLYAHLRDHHQDEVAFPDDEGREIEPKTMVDLEQEIELYAGEAVSQAIGEHGTSSDRWEGWSVVVEDAGGEELLAAPVSAFVCDACKEGKT